MSVPQHAEEAMVFKGEPSTLTEVLAMLMVKHLLVGVLSLDHFPLKKRLRLVLILPPSGARTHFKNTVEMTATVGAISFLRHRGLRAGDAHHVHRWTAPRKIIQLVQTMNSSTKSLAERDCATSRSIPFRCWGIMDPYPRQTKLLSRLRPMPYSELPQAQSHSHQPFFRWLRVWPWTDFFGIHSISLTSRYRDTYWQDTLTHCSRQQTC